MGSSPAATPAAPAEPVPRWLWWTIYACIAALIGCAGVLAVAGPVDSRSLGLVLQQAGAAFAPALAAVSAALGSLLPASEERVTALTEDSFAPFLLAHPLALVEFYAPWCGHCKRLAPEYAAAAALLAAANVTAVLAKCDATQAGKIAGIYGVKSFPTMKWFRKGVVTEYKGGRTAATIVQWVTRRSKAPLTRLRSAQELRRLQAAAPVSVVGFFEAGEPQLGAEGAAIDAAARSPTFAALLGAAELAEQADYAFGSVALLPKVGPGASKEFVAQSRSSHIVLHRAFDEPSVRYKGALTAAALLSWVALESLPSVFQFSPSTQGKIFAKREAPLLHVLYFGDKSNTDQYEENERNLRKAYASYKGAVLNVMVDTELKSNANVVKFFAVNTAALPTLRGFRLLGNKKYESGSVDFTAAGFRAFAAALEAGTLSPIVKSAPVPKSQPGPAIEVVGDTFLELVVESKKDVLLEVYAPWCGHCKKLQPIYDELAALYKTNPHVVIAKMDGTANEAAGLDVKSYPAIKLWPAGQRAPVEYKGERSLKGFQAFLAKKCKFCGKEAKCPLGFDQDGNKPAAGEKKPEL